MPTKSVQLSKGWLCPSYLLLQQINTERSGCTKHEPLPDNPVGLITDFLRVEAKESEWFRQPQNSMLHLKWMDKFTNLLIHKASINLTLVLNAWTISSRRVEKWSRQDCVHILYHIYCSSNNWLSNPHWWILVGTNSYISFLKVLLLLH